MTRLAYSDWACAAGSLSRVLSVRRCVPWPLKARGVALHLLDLGGDISGNGLSKLFLTIAAAFAEAERDRIRERIGQVKADQKARGRNLGGKVPFGYPRASPRVSQFESPQLHQPRPQQIPLSGVGDFGPTLRGVIGCRPGVPV